MSIDLRTCKPGQNLKTKHGLIVTYVGPSYGPTRSMYPHEIKYKNGGYGSRTDDGFVMANPEKRLEEDNDIVEILSMN
jgi:hypothetical protein